jgi:hypothetical protein
MLTYLKLLTAEAHVASQAKHWDDGKKFANSSENSNFSRLNYCEQNVKLIRTHLPNKMKAVNL